MEVREAVECGGPGKEGEPEQEADTAGDGVVRGDVAVVKEGVEREWSARDMEGEAELGAVPVAGEEAITAADH